MNNLKVKQKQSGKRHWNALSETQCIEAGHRAQRIYTLESLFDSCGAVIDFLGFYKLQGFSFLSLRQNRTSNVRILCTIGREE